MLMKTVKIIIEGTVQGVFFRKFIEEQANKLGLKGFVRNFDDGKVEVVIEGKDDRVEEMVDKCKEGPPQSDIKKVSTELIKHQGFTNFRILKI